MSQSAARAARRHPESVPSAAEQQALMAAAQQRVETYQLPRQIMYPGTLMKVNASPIDGSPVIPPNGMQLLVIAHPPTGEVMLFQMGNPFVRQLIRQLQAAVDGSAPDDVIAEPQEVVIQVETCERCEGKGEIPLGSGIACDGCAGRGWNRVEDPPA